jgi:hypothetical protein
VKKQKNAKVVRSKIIKDKDDPVGVAGCLYYLDVIEIYRGKSKKALLHAVRIST